MFQIHAERPTTGQIWDMVAIGSLKISKKKNEPGSLSGVFLRDYMTLERGDIIAVQTDDKISDDVDLFYGFVEDTEKANDECSATAYDQLHALQKSKVIKTYGDIKASDLYRQMSDEHKLFMLDPPNVVDSGYVVPGVIADNEAPMDLLIETLNSTFKATGKQYYVFDFFKNLCMEEQEGYRIDKTAYEINTDNLKSYSYGENGEDYINEVIIRSNDDQNTVLATRRDEQSIDRYGLITYTDRVGDGENAEVVADEIFNARRNIIPEMSVSVYGVNPHTIPGRLIHVDLYTARKEYICGWFSIESCDYTLEAGTGMMDMKLKLFQMESETFGR